MSEYQYYEWQTCERILTPEQQRAVSRLSSHITVSAHRAQVDYEWGSFKHDPIKVLLQFFDAFLYITNWGSRTLAFRFPAGLFGEEMIKAYGWKAGLEFRQEGESLLLIIESDPDEVMDDEIYGEVLTMELGEVAPLRADLLRGDARALYLAWLRTAALEEDDDEVEPPVPPGLGKLTPALKSLCKFLGLKPEVVQAAAMASPPMDASAAPSLGGLDHMPAPEAIEWLARFLTGEADLALKLRKRLLELQPTGAPTATTSAAVQPGPVPRGERTWADLREEIERLRGEEALRRLAEEQTARLAQLETTRLQQERLWRDVARDMDQKTGPGYDKAVATLLMLHDLAQFDETLPAFRNRLQTLRDKFANRPALTRRMTENGIIW